ncbi:hypothetical protein M1O16_02035 [Dehalococcoidia bacterium]|nr:hypothetical protein [Dehalococcoidia bacterium]
MGDKSKKEEGDINTLLVEYEQCFSNYAYRDQLGPHEFYLAIMIIGALVGVLEIFAETMGAGGIFIILLIGFFALYILHIDLMSNNSCKRAARERALEIECQVGRLSNSETALQLMHKIGARKKYSLEKMLKKGVSTGYLMIWFVRFLAIGWILYGISVLL